VDASTGVADMGRQDGAVTPLASTGRPGAVPVAVAEGLARVYLAHGYTWVGIPGNALDILNARRQTLLYRRRVRNMAGYMAVDDPLNALFVATHTGISYLDARTGRLLGWTWSNGPNAVVVDRHTQHVFVPVGGPGSVSMLDAHTGHLLRTVLMPLRPLQRLTPLVLLSPTIRRDAPRLVHRQNRGHEQHQQGDTGVEQRGWAPQLVDIVQGRCRHCGYNGAKYQHEHQQAEIAEDVNQEFRQDPIVPEQAPLGAQ
jgi:DNA-binding beta-propeller fold protein YncE